MIGHEPVLLSEVLELLQVRSSGTYVDATVGLGGHSLEILKRIGPDGRLVGLDQDEDALAVARERLPGDNVTIMRGNFGKLEAHLREAGISGVDGILMDLGVSSLQLDTPSRGFSFRWDGPLDMRMDVSSGVPASELVNRLQERELADLIFRLGEEHRSRSIARAIVRKRPVRTCSELASIVESVVPRRGRTHPATRTFQALRIAVNGELDILEPSLREAAALLHPEGRLCVIAYHSLEDRIVKDTFRDLKGKGFAILTPKPVMPAREEILRNPRARSAKLRAIRKAA